MRADDPRRPIILLMITGAMILLAGFAALMFAIKKKLNAADEVQATHAVDAPRLPAGYTVREMLVTDDDRAILHVTSDGAGAEVYIIDMKRGTILSRLPEADDPQPAATANAEVPQ